jgi:16S rRNA (cytosine967-C5)-methyltransferase
MVLKSVFSDKTFLNMALKALRSDTDQRDIAYITLLTNSTLENYSQIDYILKRFVTAKRVHASIKIILSMAICEIAFLNTPENAAVNEYVNLTKEIGKEKLSGFVNAVLRNYVKQKDIIVYPDRNDDLKAYLRVFSGYQDWFIEEIIAEYGEDFAKDFLLYKPKHIGQSFVRLNTLKDTKENILNEINAEELEYEKDIIFDDGVYIKKMTNVQNRAIFKQGKIAVQGKASMLTVSLSGIKPDMRVLDACAAPGGKTAYMSALMENSGDITAFDIHEHRVDLIEKNMQRLGVKNVSAQTKDASEFDEKLKANFDIVFLDMPCSSMGLAYKKADIKLFKQKEDIEALAKIQKSILNITKSYVKKGGIIMVITCSIVKKECDLNWFFKKNKDYIEEKMIMPDGVDYVKAQHGIKLFPHISKMDGFFICKIRRN